MDTSRLPLGVHLGFFVGTISPQEEMMFYTTFRVLVVSFALCVLSAQDNLKFGNPGCKGSDREEADRRFFHLCHSSDLKIPLWVGYELKEADLDGPAERTNNFRQDRNLASPGSKDSDYVRSGFSRGHMAPAEDFSRSEEAMRTTFMLSNIVPQLQGVNGGRWAQLEAAVRKIVKQSGRAYIFTGPVFDEPLVDTIGDGEVGVPTHTFKVVLVVGPGTAMKMYGAIMPNASNVSRPLNTFAVTVREVEQRTGFDFFSELDDTQERSLESKKEPSQDGSGKESAQKPRAGQCQQSRIDPRGRSKSCRHFGLLAVDDPHDRKLRQQLSIAVLDNQALCLTPSHAVPPCWLD